MYILMVLRIAIGLPEASMISKSRENGFTVRRLGFSTIAAHRLGRILLLLPKRSKISMRWLCQHFKEEISVSGS